MTDRNKTRILKALSRLDRAESNLNFLLHERFKGKYMTKTMKGIIFDIESSIFNIKNAKTLITNLKSYDIANRTEWVNWKNDKKTA